MDRQNLVLNKCVKLVVEKIKRGSVEVKTKVNSESWYEQKYKGYQYYRASVAFEVIEEARYLSQGEPLNNANISEKNIQLRWGKMPSRKLLWSSSS